jgi:hypothetical protein
MTLKTRLKPAGWTLSLMTMALLMSTTSALGMGPKPQDPNTPAPNAGVQAIPFRYVQLAKVTVPNFYLPNGVRADLNADLATIVDTAINGSRYLRTLNVGTTQNTTGPRLIMTGGITSFEVDVLQLNLKIGWNQAGSIVVNPGLPGVEGEMDFRLSAFSMDIKIFDSVTGHTYMSKSTNADLANLKFKVKANISDLTTALEVLYKMKVAETVRKATLNIMKQMEEDKNFHVIPWQASIVGIDREQNWISFNAGSQDGIAKQQVYSIYSGCLGNGPETGCFERWLADVKVSKTGNRTSEASTLTETDSLRSVNIGDLVLVKPLQNTKGK